MLAASGSLEGLFPAAPGYFQPELSRGSGSSRGVREAPPAPVGTAVRAEVGAGRHRLPSNRLLPLGAQGPTSNHTPCWGSRAGPPVTP